MARLRWVACVAAVGIFAYYVVVSVRWPLVWDSAVMHYITFLTSKGLRPYSEIKDMNLPGSYLSERLGMAVFGWSDLGWRVYEFFLLGVLAVGGMVAGGARRWFAGVLAVTFFVLMHGSEGPLFAVERDETMTVLMVVATALLFLALRRSEPGWLLLFGFVAGFETAIKPSGLLLDLALLVLMWVVVRGRGVAVGRYLLWALAGHVAAAALVVGYLVHYGALRNFFFVLRTVLPSYGRTNVASAAYLVRHFMPPELMPLIVLAAVIAVMRGGRIGWERWALFLGMAAGAVSYFAQRKGFPYHRYMFVVFALLWVGWELTEGTRDARVRLRLMGTAGVMLLFVVVAPFYIVLMQRDRHRGDNPAALAQALGADLTQLGGERLQQQVQCMDLVNGCLNALYHLRLVGNTGATGDMLLFAPQRGADVDYYRGWFAEQEQAHPADVVVVGNEWYQGASPSFAKLDAWPQYAAFLHGMYVPVVERRFGDAYDPAYRIYLRRGSAALAAEEADRLR
jgi:hypothetical protein